MGSGVGPYWTSDGFLTGMGWRGEGKKKEGGNDDRRRVARLKKNEDMREGGTGLFRPVLSGRWNPGSKHTYQNIWPTASFIDSWDLGALDQSEENAEAGS